MATTSSLRSKSSLDSWALPIAATIVVAGSLIFWLCVGLLWLAAREQPQQPIVIWIPSATGPPDVGAKVTPSLHTAAAPKVR
jgi:hypothetical protein